MALALLDMEKSERFPGGVYARHVVRRLRHDARCAVLDIHGLIGPEDQAKHAHAAIEASGGSAGNTVAGVASLGGGALYLGKVADDELGRVFAHDMRAIGVSFDTI